LLAHGGMTKDGKDGKDFLRDINNVIDGGRPDLLRYKHIIGVCVMRARPG